MTNGEAINWIINISADIGKAEHRDLWHYEQALSEIREMLESAQPDDKDINVPTNDTISRQAAINALGGRPMVWTDDDQYALGERNQYDMDRLAIETLPAAQPEHKWIPVSERLPEYNDAVLTWDGRAFCIEKRIPYIRDDDGEPIEGDWWVGDEYDEYVSECYPNLRDGAAIAWMPLSEPYKEEGNE